MSVESLRGIEANECMVDELASHPGLEKLVAGEFKPVECKSCGILLNYKNSNDGRECMMCEMPAIIATHW